MTPDDLAAAAAARRTLSPSAPPLVRALWCDAAGDWAGAHALAQDVDTADGAWVHAYLHRREGDVDNAAYWYRRAGRAVERGDLQAEWRAIARVLLASTGGDEA
jgi:hypothetical protein